LNKVDERFKQLFIELIKTTDEELERFIDYMESENNIAQSTKDILKKMIGAIKETRQTKYSSMKN